ncbi:hypothetical protein D3C80_1486680 [compost metagenome]
MEGLAEIFFCQLVQNGQAPEYSHLSNFGDNCLRVDIFSADEGHAMNRNIAAAQRFDGHQRMIDRAKRCTGAENDRNAPAREDICENGCVGQRYQQAARAFYDQWAGAGGWLKSGRINFHTLKPSGQVR